MKIKNVKFDEVEYLKISHNVPHTLLRVILKFILMELPSRNTAIRKRLKKYVSNLDYNGNGAMMK